MPVTKWNVALTEAIELVAAMQEAAELDRIPFSVLDVGGAIKPYVFATHVIDLLPYDNRAWFGHIGPADVSPELGRASERFSKDTWVAQDICETPWPYDDKAFDVVWCTQTVEDLRDPITVLKEMSRVGKTGYLNTICRNFESLKGAEDPRYAGYAHHRWFIEPDGDRLKFAFKFPLIHVESSLAPPQTGERELGLWWVKDIAGWEYIPLSREEIEDYFKTYNASLNVEETWETYKDA